MSQLTNKNSENLTLTLESIGGENPYMYIAFQLGFAEQMLEQINIYKSGNRSAQSYRDLIDWEIENYNKSFYKKFKRFPVKGDLESMLPDSKILPQALKTVPQLISQNKAVYVLSSGFRELVIPVVGTLGLPPKNVYANYFEYDPGNGKLVDVKINVSGNKISALDKIIKKQQVDPTNVSYIGDNDWDVAAMKHLLTLGGIVYYLHKPDYTKLFPISDNFVLEHSNFNVIQSITDLLSNDSQCSCYIFDADGVLIDIE